VVVAVVVAVAVVVSVAVAVAVAVAEVSVPTSALAVAESVHLHPRPLLFFSALPLSMHRSSALVLSLLCLARSLSLVASPPLPGRLRPVLARV
jgi:hypothetical protein